MPKYIAYEVQAFKQTDHNDRDLVWSQCADDEAELFCIYGQIGVLNWEWIQDVPTREQGERLIRPRRGRPLIGRTLLIKQGSQS